jgi:chemotaxis protein histidine kinase CheA
MSAPVIKPAVPGIAVAMAPDERLRKAMVPGKQGLDEETMALAKAEAALAGLSQDFEEWMQEECKRLNLAYLAWRRDMGNKRSRDVLFRAAHDIAGQSQTFGFPHAGRIGDGLRRVLEGVAEPSVTAISAHVDAIAAIVRQGKDNHDHPLARMLVQELDRLGRHVIEEEQKRIASLPPEEPVDDVPLSGSIGG